MPRISLSDVKKINPKTLLKMIDRAKQFIKKNQVFKDMCKDYNVDEGFIDLVPMKFGDLDVSARTARGIITLNYKLLCDGDFFKDYHYIIHELVHYCQQCFGEEATQGADDGEYLDNPFEIGGFQRQIEYVDDMFGKNEAEDYVDNLLEHHNVDKEKRQDKKETLMELADDK